MSDDSEVLIQCYNKGCTKKFKADENDSQSCQYHPGEPYFHDAYKIWSCCNKKSTDFTEWLNLPGCTRGPHNPEKPPEPEKPVKSANNSAVTETQVHQTRSFRPPPKAASRNENQAFVPLKKIVNSQVYENIKKRMEQKAAAAAENIENSGERVTLGTSCKNPGCTSTFQGESSNRENCWYHAGSPVFHEGLKYWSCCKKTTTDFEAFLNQEGCTLGKHQWFETEGTKKSQQCRYDWHQTSSTLVITVYAKGTMPDQSDISANNIGVKGAIEYDYGTSLFPVDFELWGAVDLSQSSVSITPSKVELKLRKDTPTSWPRLEYDPDRDATVGNS